MAERVNTVNTYTHDALIGAADPEPRTSVVSLIRGSGTVVRGTVLGKINLGASSKAAKTGGNTGDGTLTLDVTTPVLAGAKTGVYAVRVIRAAIAGVGTTPAVPAEKALVELKDPDGDVIESFELPTTPGITLSNQVKFAMVEGSTAFVVGDGFDITIAAGSGLYKIVNSANIDGSNVAECVLAETTVVASGAESKAVVYTRGVFNEDHLVYSGSDTYATHAERLRMLGILLTEEK